MRSSAELPDELIIREILTRLPVQDVLCFRCVSKSWLFLLTDPGFVEHHIIRNHLHNYDYLIAQKDNGIFVLSRYKETSGLSLDDYELVGSVHGLVCLCNDQALLLWNPAIQQYKEFAYPVIKDSYFPTGIGLGFDPVNNDYKVVVCYLQGDSKCAYVYSSSSNLWTDLFIPDDVFDIAKYPWGRHWERNVAPKAIVKDCPYWIICTQPGSNEMYKPVKFDAGSNEFKLLPSYTSRDKEFEFVNMDDCLTILEYEQISTAICVHVYCLKAERYWDYVKYYKVESGEFHFVRTIRSVQGFDRGSEIKFLRRLRPTQGFEHGGNIVWHQDGIFLCNDQDTNVIKAIYGRSCTKFALCCFRYKPSLVFLRGMKPIYSLNQTQMADD